jgi:sporulation protein YabP
MEREEIKGTHTLYLENRKSLSITGVKEVISFDEESISVITCMGSMELRGTGIKIGSFNTDTGDMMIEGKFVAIVYLNDANGKEGFFKRLFR